MNMPRQRVQALARGQSDGRGIAVPLAAEVAARIQERDWVDFTTNPTSLANGLRDLVDAVQPDGVAVISPGIVLEAGGAINAPQIEAACEATKRLRASMGDRVALSACLPGPAALPHGPEDLLALGKEFLAAGADAIVVLGHHQSNASLDTLTNIARFHQAAALGCCADQDLPTVMRSGLENAAPGRGMVLSDHELPAGTDVTALQEWVVTARG